MPLPGRHLFTHLTLHLGLQRQLGATRGPFLPGSLLFSAACGHVRHEFSFQPLCQDLWVESKCAIYPKCTRKAHYFAIDLPHSDDGFVRAFPAETTEAFLEGHVQAFAYFGGVPTTILYDNTRLAVARILGDGTRQKTRAFSELQSHYLFAEKFGRPAKGNDKGNVEGLVGYARRNFLVPIPRVGSWEELNVRLLEQCRERRARRLRGHQETIGERLERDRAAFLPLPASAYEACEKRVARVSSMSLVRYRTNDYSVPTEYGHRDVLAKGYVHEVVIVCGSNPMSSEKSLPMCNRQLNALAGRGWRNEICERNSSYSIGSVESPSASCDGGEAHRPKTGLAGFRAWNFANASRGYPTPVSGREAERELSNGDRVQFTAPSKDLQVANRDLGTVGHVNSNGDLRIRMDSGQEVRFNVREHPHLDYGYAVTSHSSQGQTADRVLIHVDTEKSELLVNNRFAYVSVSRAQHDAHIYTNDGSKLSRSLSRESSQRTATEVEQELAAPKAEPVSQKGGRPSEQEQGLSLGIGLA